ncbi:MAG TPA: o-succinylbenzoate synthase [Actinomycetales bacterium]|nr:o-succinylbenzoate synthase [Actinomycetales bacterium]
MSLPSLDDLLVDAHVVTLPMRVRFRGALAREVLLLRGPAGWGEFGPFVEYGDAEASWWLASAVEAAWRGWPEPLRRHVTVNATVPAVPPDQVAGVLAVFGGCATAKVKVAEAGQARSDDVARVAEVRALLGPAGRIRVDANGAWDVDTAVETLTALARYDLEYAEQPCASWRELRELRLRLAAAGTDVPIAADESIRKAEDPFTVAAGGAVDLAVVKVAPMGGVRRTLAVVERLRAEHGLPVVVSSALDSGVGIAAGLAAAAALPDEPPACGLATTVLLVRDVVEPPVVPSGGVLAVGARAPDPGALVRLAAPVERRGWWLDRVARCYRVLERRAGSSAW